METTAPESAQIPEEFAAYEQWHAKQGEPQTEAAVETEKPAAVEETAKTTPPESETENEQEHGQKGHGFQKRIDKLTAKIRDLESRLESKPGVASPPPPAETKAVTELKAENFQTYDEYVVALAKHTLREEREAERKAQEQKAAQDAAQKAQSDWDERRVKATEQHEDWEEVVGAAAIPVSRALHDALLTSEYGPEIAYQLAKNPAEAQRISALSPLEQVKAIGKLEAKFETPEPDQPKVSRAPKPPTPVTGSMKSSFDIYDDKAASDYGAWERARNAQLRRR